MTPALSLRTDPSLPKTREIGGLVKASGLPEGRWKALVWKLVCFKTEAELIEITAEDDPAGNRHYFLRTGAALEPVRYDTAYVQGLAAKLGLIVSRDTSDDYVRLYLGFTRGQAGRVIPIEQIDQLPLREELTLITRRKLQSMITPLTVIEADAVSGCFLIGDKLFSATATVSADGLVSLEPQSLLADTLPVLDSVFEG